ncbi:hypothetical protein C8R44DRAFT_989581 [Mycena epipterygia]|nr:hypothetical protein C8R44DRAFT_989581 [Mycena epipterygia]
MPASSAQPKRASASHQRPGGLGRMPAWVGAGALTSTHEHGERAGESNGHAPLPGMSHSPSQSDSLYSSISSAGQSSVSSAPVSYSHSHPHAYSTHSTGGAKGWTSDAGWGRMLRTGQTLLASALGRVGYWRVFVQPPEGSATRLTEA